MKIAIVGSGIAGLGAAYLLSRQHEVVLLEREPVLGGHVRTHHTRTPDGRTLGIDTGFIVHNRPNYPLLVRLFQELEVPTQDSEMSFSVSAPALGIEYAGTRLLRQPQNLRPRVVGLLAEVARFLRHGQSYMDGRFAGMTLGQMAAAAGYSQRFCDLYLMPLTAAIWSSPPDAALDFPAEAALRFFDNHGLLGFSRHQWRTVTGGAQTYVDAIIERLPVRARTGTPVRGVSRPADGVTLRLADGETLTADAVVIATHGDEALALLDDPSDEESRILGTFTTLDNEAVLHTDERLLPRRASVRSAWNYLLEPTPGAPRPTVTYSLNRLQALDAAEEYCVTLNRPDIAPERVIWRTSYRHPQYTEATFGAQRRLARINGARRTWFCGAWAGWGFHEDGLRSAVAAARDLGVDW